MRADFRSTLFHAIGRELVATDEARDFLDTETASDTSNNDRLYDLTLTVSEFTSRQWLTEQGIDLGTAVHSELLALSETIKEDIPAAAAQLKQLYEAIEGGQKNHADDQLIRTAQGVLSDVGTAIQRALAGDPKAITDQDMSILNEAVFVQRDVSYRRPRRGNAIRA